MGRKPGRHQQWLFRAAAAAETVHAHAHLRALGGIRTTKENLTEALEGETHERKAFGLVGGRKSGSDFLAEKCFPLIKNVRNLEPYANFMDQAMQDHAIPSETPFAKRGWIAEPEELLGKIRQFQQEDQCLLGAYHMHRVAWPDDPLRDRPTTLDTVLAAESGIFIYIVSMVDPTRPLIRAFYEADPAKEIPVLISSLAK